MLQKVDDRRLLLNEHLGGKRRFQKEEFEKCEPSKPKEWKKSQDLQLRGLATLEFLPFLGLWWAHFPSSWSLPLPSRYSLTSWLWSSNLVNILCTLSKRLVVDFYSTAIGFNLIRKPSVVQKVFCGHIPICVDLFLWWPDPLDISVGCRISLGFSARWWIWFLARCEYCWCFFGVAAKLWQNLFLLAHF